MCLEVVGLDGLESTVDKFKTCFDMRAFRIHIYIFIIICTCLLLVRNLGDVELVGTLLAGCTLFQFKNCFSLPKPVFKSGKGYIFLSCRRERWILNRTCGVDSFGWAVGRQGVHK